MPQVELFADFSGESEAIHVRQLEIQEQRIKRAAPGKKVQSGAAAGGRFNGEAPLSGALRDDTLIGHVVFDDEQALAQQLRLLALPDWRGGRSGGIGGDGEVKRGALASIAVNPDFAAQHFRQSFANGQTQASAAEMAGSGGVNLLE